MIALTPRIRHPYVLERDRKLPGEKRTTFYLRTLTVEERASLADRAGEYSAGTGQIQMRTGSAALATVRAGLCGWDNLQDAKGGTVPFAADPARSVLGGHTVTPPSDTSLDQLDWAAIVELANAIRANAELSDEDAKNS